MEKAKKSDKDTQDIVDFLELCRAYSAIARSKCKCSDDDDADCYHKDDIAELEELIQQFESGELLIVKNIQ